MEVSKYTAGFSLIECLITIGIITILASFAFPAYQYIIERFHADHALGQLYRAIQITRMEAIKRNQMVTLCALVKNTCKKSNWAKGYVIFIDDTRKAKYAKDNKLYEINGVASEGELVWKGLRNQPYLQFLPNGFPNAQNGTFIYTSPHGYVRKLIMIKTGRARFE